jgi:hypothetical protein
MAMSRRSKRTATRENAAVVADRAAQLAADRTFRKRLLKAIAHGMRAERRVWRQVGLVALVNRLAADRQLRAELAQMPGELQRAWRRVDRTRSHRLRNTLVVVGGAGGLAAAAAPPTRARLGRALAASRSGRADRARAELSRRAGRGRSKQRARRRDRCSAVARRGPGNRRGAGRGRGALRLRGFEHSWSSTQVRLADGAVESSQRMNFPAPVVERTGAGARKLGDLYWRVLREATFGVLRTSRGADAFEIRLLGRGPALLRFSCGEEAVSIETVSCRYAILGGLLARAPAGSICFTQEGTDAVAVTSAVEGFLPRLGVLYAPVQSRLHVALGRRYFTRLRREAKP